MFDVIRPLVIGRLASPRFMWEHDASFAVQSMHKGLFACARRHSRHCVKTLPFDGCVEGSGWSVPGSRESHFLPRRRSPSHSSEPRWPVGGVSGAVERAGSEAESMGRGIAGPAPSRVHAVPVGGIEAGGRCYSRCHSRCDSLVLVGHAPYSSRHVTGGRHGQYGAKLSMPKWDRQGRVVTGESAPDRPFNQGVGGSIPPRLTILRPARVRAVG